MSTKINNQCAVDQYINDLTHIMYKVFLSMWQTDVYKIINRKREMKIGLMINREKLDFF